MSQGYIHACERAELLGLPIPSEEEWKETHQDEVENHVNEDDENEAMQNLETSDEAAQRISGGLDELNSILNATQKKINRFKTVCGSISGILKVRVGSRHNTPNHKPSEKNYTEVENEQQEPPAEEESTIELSEDTNEVKVIENHPVTPRKIDLNQKMGSHLDKLDSLISKAENAQYSMQHQTKQMRQICKK